MCYTHVPLVAPGFVCGRKRVPFHSCSRRQVASSFNSLADTIDGTAALRSRRIGLLACNKAMVGLTREEGYKGLGTAVMHTNRRISLFVDRTIRTGRMSRRSSMRMGRDRSASYLDTMLQHLVTTIERSLSVNVYI